MFQRSNRMCARSSNRVNHDRRWVSDQKHNRRAAKAAFAIALGVAIVLGGAAAAPAALDKQQATPIIIRTKDFPEQYVLGSSTSRRSRRTASRCSTRRTSARPS